MYLKNNLSNNTYRAAQLILTRVKEEEQFLQERVMETFRDAAGRAKLSRNAGSEKGRWKEEGERSGGRPHNLFQRNHESKRAQ